jgi:hypothetical protein
MKEGLVLGGVAAADRMRLVMQMVDLVLRMHHLVVDVLDIEVKHARLAMIDPDDGMEMLAHGTAPVM